MIYRLEQSDIDFGYTTIDNIFIEDFMPIADGDYVKVYLYTYKHILAGTKLTDEIIAKNLQLTLTDVKRAWKYWEDRGVVSIKEGIDDTRIIEYIDLKKLYVENISSVSVPKPSPTQTLMDTFVSNERIREMFGSIDYHIRRQTTPVEKTEILQWITEYNMSPDIIELAFDYSADRQKRINVNYVKGVVRGWYDEKLFTLDDIIDKLQQSDERYVRKNYVMNKLGLPFRTVSDTEIDTINNWYDTFDEDIVDEALNRTSGIANPSINYADAIITRWEQLGVKEHSDIQKLDVRRRPTTKTRTGFHNFEGQTSSMSDEELNRLAEQATKKRGY